jgi:hypothetical protein
LFQVAHADRIRAPSPSDTCRANCAVVTELQRIKRRLDADAVERRTVG